jgi:hypothetical protein
MCSVVDPSQFRDWMTAYVEGMRALTSAVDERCNSQREPGPGSAAMGEIAAEQNYRSRSDWDQSITDTHGFGAATLRASSDYVRGFAELFDTDYPPLYAHLPLARAALEAAGTSAWLCELGIPVLERMKRGLCELLYSATEIERLELETEGRSTSGLL